MNFKNMIVILLLAGLPTVCGAQQAETTEASAEAWYEFYRERAANDYQLTYSDQELPLILKSQSILNWTNPLEQGQINGSSFVWESNGRPIVIGQFFSYLINADQRSFCHVFSTLTNQPVIGKRQETTFWTPAKSEKTEWHETSDVATPAATRPLRLMQMRQIARQFSAYTDEPSRGVRELRLLPQPLYRYDESAQGVDGGIFAYVVGNDPELLILVQCDVDKEPSVWRHRFVQSTQSTTVASAKDVEVYRYEKAGNDPGLATAVYHSRHGVDIIPAELAVD